MLADLAGGYDLIIVLLVVLLVFGSTKLPKLARSLGTASHEFKKGIEEGSKGDAENDPRSESDTKAEKGSKGDAKAEQGSKADSDDTADNKG